MKCGDRNGGLLGSKLREGWCTDPFARHEARWLSNGTPTRLVRDGGVTAYDEPPNEPFVQPACLIEQAPSASPADLLRADDAERSDQTFDHDSVYMGQMDAVWSDGAPYVTRIIKGGNS